MARILIFCPKCSTEKERSQFNAGERFCRKCNEYTNNIVERDVHSYRHRKQAKKDLANFHARRQRETIEEMAEIEKMFSL